MFKTEKYWCEPIDLDAPFASSICQYLQKLLKILFQIIYFLICKNTMQIALVLNNKHNNEICYSLLFFNKFLIAFQFNWFNSIISFMKTLNGYKIFLRLKEMWKFFFYEKKPFVYKRIKESIRFKENFFILNKSLLSSICTTFVNHFAPFFIFFYLLMKKTK